LNDWPEDEFQTKMDGLFGHVPGRLETMAELAKHCPILPSKLLGTEEETRKVFPGAIIVPEEEEVTPHDVKTCTEA